LINFNHLSEVEEGYFAHLRYNLWVSGMVLILAVVSFVHAFFPFMFPRWPARIRNHMMRKSLTRDKQISKALRRKGLPNV
jgi:hypothetical protein